MKARTRSELKRLIAEIDLLLAEPNASRDELEAKREDVLAAIRKLDDEALSREVARLIGHPPTRIVRR